MAGFLQFDGRMEVDLGAVQDDNNALHAEMVWEGGCRPFIELTAMCSRRRAQPITLYLSEEAWAQMNALIAAGNLAWSRVNNPPGDSSPSAQNPPPSDPIIAELVGW